MFGQLLIDLGGVAGVGLAGVVNETDGLGLRLQFPDELELGLHRQDIGGAGDVALGETSPHRVGDGGEHHGNVLLLGGGVTGHGGGGGDAHHQVGVLGGKALGNLSGQGRVSACVLQVDGEVGALPQTGLLQALEKALPAVVQGGVFGELGDADGVGGGFLRISGSRIGIGGGTAAGGEGQQSQQAQKNRVQFFHGCNLLFPNQ